MCVGGIKSRMIAEMLPKKMMEGEVEASDCKSCNLCLTANLRG